MRNTTRCLVAVASVAAAAALSALPAGAGGPVTNSVTIDKAVDGLVPAGTTFTVEVTCSSILSPGSLAPTPTVITFDATGSPTSNNVVNAAAGQQCTADETVDGGAAAVDYACEITRGGTDQTPPFLGNCTGDNEVTFTDVIGDDATITVTNTFPMPTPEPVIPAATAVQAPPTFTG